MTALQQVQDVLALYTMQGERKPQGASCVQCTTRLQETVTGSRVTAKGNVCSDCYFEAWGEVVEQHPISSPRRR